MNEEIPPSLQENQSSFNLAPRNLQHSISFEIIKLCGIELHPCILFKYM